MPGRSWVSNTPISTPLYIRDAVANVDLNGLKFSYELGFIYTPDAPTYPWQDPQPTDGPRG